MLNLYILCMLARAMHASYVVVCVCVTFMGNQYTPLELTCLKH